MDLDVRKYAYRVVWSVEQQAWVCTVAELPGLMYYGPDQATVLEGAVALAQDTVNRLVEQGEEPPIPFAEQKFSGSIRLRVPPAQHRELSIRAAEEGVSLNRYLCSMLLPSPRITMVGTEVKLPEE